MNIPPGSDISMYPYWHLLDRDDPDLDCDCAIVADGSDVSSLPYPLIYSLELTPTCTCHCAGCSNVFHRPPIQTPAPLSASVWATILETIAPYAQRLRLTGGEPTLHPEFAQIVAAIERYPVQFTLFTNGCWTDPDAVLSVLSTSSRCAGLLISLHGADAATHEAFTSVRGSFANTCEAIHRATQAGLKVHTNTVLSAYNHQQIDAIVELAQSLGATCSVFNRYIGRAIPGLTLSRDELIAAAHTIQQIHTTTAYRTKYGNPIPISPTQISASGCLAGVALCAIDPWGHVRPCNHAPQIAGNILTDTLETIWSSQTMKTWRACATGMVTSDQIDCSPHTPSHDGCYAEPFLKP